MTYASSSRYHVLLEMQLKLLTIPLPCLGNTSRTILHASDSMYALGRVYLGPLSFLHILPQGKPVHSRWLAVLCGIDFRWHSDCSSGSILTHSTLV